MQFWQVWQFFEPHNLATPDVFALGVFAIVGLCVGSLLNVVIYRTPLILQRQWRLGSLQFLQSQPDVPADALAPVAACITQDMPLSLWRPSSQCPQCHTPIAWRHKLPIISWLWLKGRCASCRRRIGLRYPLIELLTAVLSVLVIYQLGVSLAGLCGLVFLWLLIALVGIDFETQYLPDNLTYPLAILGLMVNSHSVFVSPSLSIWGLILGYLSLWVVVKVFYLFTRKQGMGQGDFKLLAALGAWLGPFMLPFVILLSSVLGTIMGLILLKKRRESQPFAFGPYLALAGLVALLYGEALMHWYLGRY